MDSIVGEARCERIKSARQESILSVINHKINQVSPRSVKVTCHNSPSNSLARQSLCSCEQVTRKAASSHKPLSRSTRRRSTTQRLHSTLTQPKARTRRTSLKARERIEMGT